MSLIHASQVMGTAKVVSNVGIDIAAGNSQSRSFKLL